MAKKTAGNPNDFILPDLGEGVHEAELIKWRVQVGQQVEEHEILAEMETDKALVEVPSPRSGTVSKLWGDEGQIMKVGEPLVSYEGAAQGGAQPAGKAKAEHAPHSNGTHKPAPAAAAVEEKPAENGAAREDDGTVVGKMSDSLAGMSRVEGKALATPAVRRLARDLGVDINLIAGTGIGGRVTEKDVRSSASGGAAATSRAPAARGHAPVAPQSPAQPHSDVVEAGVPAESRPSDAAIAAALRADTGQRSTSSRGDAGQRPAPQAERIPFRGVRRTIANRLRESMNRAVHFNVMDEVDVTDLDAMRRKLAAASGEKVSFLPFVASALCRVLTEDRFAVLNSTVDDEKEEIIQNRAVHIGIATDTETGLMVPVIRDCDALGVLQIGREVTRIAGAARDRSIPREQLVGSTFTISNVGSHAGRFATPVINYPEVGILAVGRAREGMVVRNGWYRVGQLLPLSLACDHRVVDGATAALALARLVELLGKPEQLLTPARG
jgi:pyruvate dehydrogenase E2 component (dihydrolipoamide acetyltransferase)